MGPSKGKVESHEKMREAAVREVEEECGLKIDYLGKKYRPRTIPIISEMVNLY